MDGLLRISLTQPDVLKIDGNFLKLGMSSAENKAILKHFSSSLHIKKYHRCSRAYRNQQAPKLYSFHWL